MITFVTTFSVMEKNHHDRNSHIYKPQEIKSYNWRPETYHITVRINNNNNNNNNIYALVCEEACKWTNFPIQCCHVTWQKNKRLKPEDSRDELINTLSGSDCKCLVNEAVMWWMNDSKRWTHQFSFWLRQHRFSLRLSCDERTTQTRRLVR